jgi:hypothetical protein
VGSYPLKFPSEYDDRFGTFFILAATVCFNIFFIYTAGKRLGGYLCNAWCTSLAFDAEAHYAFIGDFFLRFPPAQTRPENKSLAILIKNFSDAILFVTYPCKLPYLVANSATLVIVGSVLKYFTSILACEA